MELLFFGSVKENMKCDMLQVQKKFKDLGEVKVWLEKEYPVLTTNTYAMAINNKIQNDLKAVVNEQDVIALLPPFSGG